MKTTRLLLLALLAAPLALLAQTNGVAITPADEKIADIFSKLSAWQFLLVPTVMALVQALKTWVPLIPSRFLPWVAPFIGAALDYAASKAGFWTSDPAIGALIGGAAVWAHQAFTQPKGDGEAPAAPPS